jgi:hypothetical protein
MGWFYMSGRFDGVPAFDNKNNNNQALVPKFWDQLWILNRLVKVRSVMQRPDEVC